jgi:hypothetical protein
MIELLLKKHIDILFMCVARFPSLIFSSSMRFGDMEGRIFSTLELREWKSSSSGISTTEAQLADL